VLHERESSGGHTAQVGMMQKIQKPARVRGVGANERRHVIDSMQDHDIVTGCAFA
jgi:hypothetical protein